MTEIKALARRSAERMATAYAWGRQDEAATGTDSAVTASFAMAYMVAWDNYETERFWHKPNLRGAWDNWRDHGHVYDRDECGQCGRRPRFVGSPSRPEWHAQWCPRVLVLVAA